MPSSRYRITLNCLTSNLSSNNLDILCHAIHITFKIIFFLGIVILLLMESESKAKEMDGWVVSGVIWNIRDSMTVDRTDWRPKQMVRKMMMILFYLITYRSTKKRGRGRDSSLPERSCRAFGASSPSAVSAWHHRLQRHIPARWGGHLDYCYHL